MNFGKILVLLLLAITFIFSQFNIPIFSIWPSLVTLISVVFLRNAFLGLLIGAISGVILMAEGNPLAVSSLLVKEIILPALSSTWNLSVLAFTLLLGGFAAILEKGGGFESILQAWIRQSKNLYQSVEWSAFFIGILCFFDGLASSLLAGRALRPLADKTGVSRAKLAYLVDSTGSAVACIAIMSTWIAYQLSMIREGYLAAGIPDSQPFTLFLSSIPRNFYCWFTLILVVLTIRKSLNFGAMKKFESSAREQFSETDQNNTSNHKKDTTGKNRILFPLATLVGCLFLGLYLNGVDGSAWPVTFLKIKQAFGDAQSNIVLLYSSIIACMVAYLFNRKSISSSGSSSTKEFIRGIKRFISPSLVLIAAWCLSGTLRELGAASFLSQTLSGSLSPAFFPLSVFLLGILISFTTGTSWGTMGVLMPLSIPVCFSLAPGSDAMMASVIAAVFSGAVFGDHCSPMSDTTIVSAVACEISPYDHFCTQLPYALIAASVAAFAGFIPLGLGLSPWLCLTIGTFILLSLPWIRNKFFSSFP
jgi:Na+/H+ antiporter NhaC